MTDHPSLGAVARAIEDALNLKLTPKGRETVARAAIAAMPSVEAQAARIAVLEEALREIATQNPVDLALDPEWSQRIARAALAAAEKVRDLAEVAKRVAAEDRGFRAGFIAGRDAASRAVASLPNYSPELERAHAAIRALEPPK